MFTLKRNDSAIPDPESKMAIGVLFIILNIPSTDKIRYPRDTAVKLD